MLLLSACWYVKCSFVMFMIGFFSFFFKQNTADDMRISDWSSDVCSSDLGAVVADLHAPCSALESFAGGRDFELHPRHSSVSLFQPCVSDYARFDARSEERRVGKECVSTCRSRWSPYH